MSIHVRKRWGTKAARRGVTVGRKREGQLEQSGANLEKFWAGSKVKEEPPTRVGGRK